jgi:hypothetical protein
MKMKNIEIPYPSYEDNTSGENSSVFTFRDLLALLKINYIPDVDGTLAVHIMRTIN